ncbi:MAG TPA: NUDIX domain-containing protein [Ktedonobacterales bacterium]|jgi:ADP-ribose pyrophosphatase YjhB (NUDIX family)|nr:NUDIX domain-containing protein [Ktedonobacterales bacterium]
MGTQRRQTMERELAAFLRGQTPLADELVLWGDMRLRARSYLIPNLPPLRYVTAVRAIVTHQGAVLVVRDPERAHIWAGGRRQPSETVIQTLRREMLKETGWAVDGIVRLGFQHFQHLGPPPAAPAAYPYLYPDFLRAIYTAAPTQRVQAKPDAEGFGVSTAFHPLSQVYTLNLTPGERCFLDAALQLRATTPLALEEMQELQ